MAEQKEDPYTYISPYARKLQLRKVKDLHEKDALIEEATNAGTMDGDPLSTEIPCVSTPFTDQLIPVPCPSIGKPLDGADAINSLLSGILILSCHGTANFDYNLTTDYIIPYRMLFIYTTPFSFSGLSSKDINHPSHRMNKLINYRKNISERQFNVRVDEHCVGITTRTLLEAMLADTVSVKIGVDNFVVTNAEAIQIAKDKIMRTDHLGMPHIGTHKNQIYCFSNYCFYNNDDVHDAFSGLFLAAFCINNNWVSSNYNPIRFKGPPTKSQGVLPPKSNLYPTSSLLDEIKTMLVFDVSSIRDINKCLRMNNTLLNFIIRMLIARNVTFTSSIATILVKSASGHHYSTPVRLDYSFIDPNVNFDTIAEANVNGLPVINNNVKISRISAEDVSILLYVLWFISNGKWKEINIIMNLMNLMYFYYYHIMMKIPIDNYQPTDPDEIAFIEKIHNDTSLLPLTAITTFNILINNYIHEQATINKITFATIHSVCRPNANPEQNATVQKQGQLSQECEIAFNCSSNPMERYKPEEVTTAFPEIPVEAIQPIVEAIQPIVEPFEPIVDDNFQPIVDEKKGEPMEPDETQDTMAYSEKIGEQDHPMEQDQPSAKITPDLTQPGLMTFYRFLDLIRPLKIVASAVLGRQYFKYFEDFPINQYSIDIATIKEAKCTKQTIQSAVQLHQLEEETENDDHLLFLKIQINNVLNYLKTDILIATNPELQREELKQQQIELRQQQRLLTKKRKPAEDKQTFDGGKRKTCKRKRKTRNKRKTKTR